MGTPQITSLSATPLHGSIVLTIVVCIEKIAIGDNIGWVDVSVVRPAAGAFCPAVVTVVISV